MFYALGKKKLYLRQMMKSRIHKALQLEVCDQCIPSAAGLTLRAILEQNQEHQR